MYIDETMILEIEGEEVTVRVEWSGFRGSRLEPADPLEITILSETSLDEEIVYEAVCMEVA